MKTGLPQAAKLIPKAIKLLGAISKASASGKQRSHAIKSRLSQKNGPQQASKKPAQKSKPTRLGGLLKQGIKTAKLLHKAAQVSARSRKTGAAALKGGDAAKKEGKKLTVMVGPVQKNWKQATAENGFSELRPGKRGEAPEGGKRLRIMVGETKKNWKDATPEKGFREWNPGAFGKHVRVMVGKPRKNWEEATKENDFREWKPGAFGKHVRVMVGKPRKNWEEATPENGFKPLRMPGGSSAPKPPPAAKPPGTWTAAKPRMKTPTPTAPSSAHKQVQIGTRLAPKPQWQLPAKKKDDDHA